MARGERKRMRTPDEFEDVLEPELGNQCAFASVPSFLLGEPGHTREPEREKKHSESSVNPCVDG